MAQHVASVNTTESDSFNGTVRIGRTGLVFYMLSCVLRSKRMISLVLSRLHVVILDVVSFSLQIILYLLNTGGYP